eukprot:gene5103-6770_t
MPDSVGKAPKAEIRPKIVILQCNPCELADQSSFRSAHCIEAIPPRCLVPRRLYNSRLNPADCSMTHTHFGYQNVQEDQKVHKVAEVFHSVAAKYDVMNDLMSAGLHRVWKMFTIAQAGIRPGFKVLDIAGGT